MTFDIYTTVFAFAAGWLLGTVPVFIGAHYEYWRLAREERRSRKQLKIPKAAIKKCL